MTDQTEQEANEPLDPMAAALVDLILDAELRLADVTIELATVRAEIEQKRILVRGLKQREHTLKRALALAEWRDQHA